MALTIPSRSPWEDRFRTPTAAELRGALAPQFHVPFEHARAKLTQIPGASETIRWHGVWKWTFEYACAGESHGEVFAFLVADPARPRVCISVTDAAMSGMDLRKLSKGVREGLASAPAVDGTRWATWDVTSKSGVDEIGAFVAAYRTAIGMPHELPEPPLPASSDVKVTPNTKAVAKPSVKTGGKARGKAASTSGTDAPGSAKSGSAKPSSGKLGSSSHAAQANGTASPSTGHKAGPNGTRRARGA